MNINGSDLLIYAGGSVVAAAKSCRISMSVDMIEAAGQTDGKAREFVPAMKEWQISTTSLVTVAHTFFEGHGTSVRLTFAVRDKYGNILGDKMTGYGFLAKSEITAAVESLIKGSFVFQGVGELAREMDGLRDYNQKDLYDYNGGNRLRAPSSTL